MGVFWAFATAMAALAGTTLIWQHTFLSNAWRLNPIAYQVLAPVGTIAGPLFLLFSGVLLITTVGWFKQRVWGWRLGIAILLTQLAGDLFNLIRGDFLRGGVGVAIASGLLYFLMRRQVRQIFT
jgi:hypothetical protein